MLSVHKNPAFYTPKTSQYAISNLLQTLKRTKIALYKFNKQIWDFLPCAHLLCLYTALRHS